MVHGSDLSGSRKPPMTKTLTRAEAAAILGCGERHVSTLLKEKRIKGRVIGRVLRLDPVSVEEYKNTRRPPGRPRSSA